MGAIMNGSRGLNGKRVEKSGGSWKPLILIVGSLIAHSSLYYYMAVSRALQDDNGGAGDLPIPATQYRGMDPKEWKELAKELRSAAETLQEMKSAQSELHQNLRTTIDSSAGSGSSQEVESKLNQIIQKIDNQPRQAVEAAPQAAITSQQQEVDSATGLPMPPPIIFTQCCWCPKNQTWYPGSNYFLDSISGDINFFRRTKGIDARFLQMPCNRKVTGPDLTDPIQRAEWERYALQLKEARDNGAIIATALHRRVGPKNCCVDAEAANVWVERALAGGDEKQVAKVMQLQNKSSLHDAFVGAGEEDRVPKLYTEEEVKAKKIKYPVFAKATRGIFGQNVWAITNETEFDEVMRKNRRVAKSKGIIVEEALVGDRPYTIHYLSWFNPATQSYKVSWWCGVYEKEWATKGIFVQGQDKNPPIKRVECEDADIDAFTRVIEHTGMKQGLGCVNGKDTDGPGTIKIFDWNIRMCGSLRKNIIDDMYMGLGTAYTGTRLRELPGHTTYGTQWNQWNRTVLQ